MSLCGGDLKVLALNYNYKHKEKQYRTHQLTLDDFELTEIHDLLDVIEWEGFMSYNTTDHRGRQICCLQLNHKEIKTPSIKHLIDQGNITSSSRCMAERNCLLPKTSQNL